MLRPVAASAAVLFALTGLAACGADEPSAQPSSPTTSKSPDADSVKCRQLLSDAEAEAFAGKRPSHPIATRVAQLDACRWDLEMGEWVQVVDVPAAEWAAQLPAALEQAKAAGQLDKAALATLEKSIKEIGPGRQPTGKQACAMFSTWAVKLQGAPKGSDVVLSFIPAPPSTPQAVNAQRCVNGRYSSAMLVESNLQGSEAELERARTALAALGS